MKLESAGVLALMFVSSSALAVPNVSLSISQQANVHVYDVGRWTFTVSNIGAHTANSVSLAIQLPATHTSPQVYVMGDVIAFSSSCTRSGLNMTCNLGNIRRNRSASVWVDLALPESAAPIVVSGTASASGDNTPANNSASLSASLLHYDVVVNGPRDVHNRHCTGTTLTAFYECTKFPSSIASHDIVLEADHTVSFVGVTGYTGVWSQASNQQLHFEYYELGSLVATFDGWGVDGNCFEGMTTFNPPSAYVSAYEVCLQ